MVTKNRDRAPLVGLAFYLGPTPSRGRRMQNRAAPSFSPCPLRMRSASCNPRGQEEAPPMKHYDKDQRDQLNSFLRGERSAVETYRLALRSMGSEDSGRGARRGLRPRSERLPPRSSQPRSDRSSVRGAERRARASRARASREPPHAQRAEASDRLIRRFFSSAASAIGPRWRVGASHALVIVRPTPRGG